MNIIIRVDSTKEIGAGHVMRTFALAEELISRGHKVIYCFTQMLPSLKVKLCEVGAELKKIKCTINSDEDILQTLQISKANNIDAIIVDGYGFNENYLLSLHKEYKLIFIDDEAILNEISADIIINPSPFSFEMPYEDIAINAKLLLGPKYALLRSEFRSKADHLLPLNERKNILVTFGGTDVAELTAPTVECLLQHSDKNQIIDVVVGKDFSYNFPEQIKIHKNCDYMAELMATAKLAISAGGSTLAELALMKVPTLLIIVANNQERHALWAQKNEMNIVIDAREKNEKDVLMKIALTVNNMINNFDYMKIMADKNYKLAEGNGVNRIVDEITA